MAKRGLFFGAAVLLVCNFVSRMLGFVYKIVLVRLIGTAGIGVTEMASPVYTFALVAASLGIPVALSRLLAQELGQGHTPNLRPIQRTALVMLAVLGSLAAALCWWLAPALTRHIGNPAATAYLRLLCPAILLVTVCSGFRAYFQATKQIAVIGLSQNLEQMVRVAAGSALVFLALPYGQTVQIAAVATATVLGEFVGLLFILLMYLKSRPLPSAQANPGRAATACQLLSFGAPITVQRLISSAILMLQATLIPLMLQKSGLSATQATSAYGSFSGVALSLIHLPGIFTATLALALLPSIAECEHNPARLNSRINQSLHITAVIALPFALVFAAFADELTRWLFHAPAAAASLRILALAAPFIYAQTALTSILQGLGRLSALFISLMLSGGLFVGAIRLLVPALGIAGAALAELVFAAAATVIDLIFLRRYTHLTINAADIAAKPLLAAAVAALLAKLGIKTAEKLLSAAAINEYANFLLQCSVGALAYLAVLAACGGLPRVFSRLLPAKFRK